MKKIVAVMVFFIFFCALCAIIVSGFVVHNFCAKERVSSKKTEKMIVRKNRLLKHHGAQEISLVTDDGMFLSGLLINRENAKRAVLCCHGYRGSKEQMSAYVDLFPNDTVLLFDFRAHGQSAGSFITFGYHEKRDVKAAVEFLRSHTSTRDLPIIGLGCSMGGASLLLAAAHDTSMKALIIDSSFANFYEQVAHVFSQKTGLPLMVFMNIVCYLFEYFGSCHIDHISPRACLKHITIPIFFIHSRTDSFTPFYHGEQMYERAQQKKKMWKVAHAAHAQSIKIYKNEYAVQVEDFLSCIGI
jgi:pimeloyl-ACP methyl ester carboxylesterase